MPYVHLDIDDEDSLSTRFDRGSERRAIDIAVVRLPRISNFTDVSPFERYENVSVRYIERAAELGAPDMIVLPGTKSTIADLKWLRESGLEAAILKAADGGTLVFGICGGYQMLGRSVSDPEQVEAAGITDIAGMGLLDMGHRFSGRKGADADARNVLRVAGELACLNGLSYEGYEIHMDAPEARGVVTGGGNVYGSYIHGIFDAPGVADAVLGALCRKKGLSPSILGAFDPVPTARSSTTSSRRSCAMGWTWSSCTVSSTGGTERLSSCRFFGNSAGTYIAKLSCLCYICYTWMNLRKIE